MNRPYDVYVRHSTIVPTVRHFTSEQKANDFAEEIRLKHPRFEVVVEPAAPNASEVGIGKPVMYTDGEMSREIE